MCVDALAGVFGNNVLASQSVMYMYMYACYGLSKSSIKVQSKKKEEEEEEGGSMLSVFGERKEVIKIKRGLREYLEFGYWDIERFEFEFPSERELA